MGSTKRKDRNIMFISLSLLVLATVLQSGRLSQNNFLKIWISWDHWKPPFMELMFKEFPLGLFCVFSPRACSPNSIELLKYTILSPCQGIPASRRLIERREFDSRGRTEHCDTVKNELKVLVTQLCLTLCDPMDCSPLGSSVHGISQAKILEWVAISFSRGSSWPRDWTQVSCIAGGLFTVRATSEDMILHGCSNLEGKKINSSPLLSFLLNSVWRAAGDKPYGDTGGHLLLV